MKQYVGLIFGGRSDEHDVSWISGQSIADQIDAKRWVVQLIYIDRNGTWWHLSDPQAFLKACTPNDYQGAKAKLSFHPHMKNHCITTDTGKRIQCDVALPMIHGQNGEDGTLQGFLHMLGLPIAGCQTLGSAITFDKVTTKRLAQSADIAVVPYLVCHQHEPISYQEILDTLGLPCFIKPARSGSSIGISKVKSHEELAPALKNAFAVDDTVLIEQAMVAREIECSVLADPTPRTSLPGEIITPSEFYDYEAKYHDDGLQLFAPADLPKTLQDQVRALALKAFKVTRCAQMARVDFFLDDQGQLWLNEINAIPGFTSVSLYPKLWQISGLSYSDLINRLLDQALEDASI